MATINSPQSPNDSAVDINLNTEYIKMAKKGGGHNGNDKWGYFMGSYSLCNQYYIYLAEIVRNLWLLGQGR